MIFGVGNDLIEIKRVVDACQNRHFMEKYFTPKEIILLNNDIKKAADNFAVKEAIVKMFGTGFGKIEPIHIEVLRDDLGKPYVVLYKSAKAFSDKYGIKNIYVSISNIKEYASAIAIGEV